jgi:hypothetical protein
MRPFLVRGSAWLVIASLGLLAAADEPAQPEPVLGIQSGETLPFFVADFCHGKLKDRGACPGAVTSNHKAKAVLILARDTNEEVLALVAALEKQKIVDGKQVLTFVIKLGERDAALADKCQQAGLTATEAGTIRGQSLQTLSKRGLAKETELAVLFLDRKAVQASHLFQAGELTAEKSKELVVAAEAWAKIPKE